MKRVIVTTTVNPPTEAIQLFDSMPGWQLIVAGDLKTPVGYHLNHGIYLSPKDQEDYDKQLSDAIGWNCIQRRNFGILMAHDLGADVIALVDDDNIPLSGWGENLVVGEELDVELILTGLSAFDPVGATNYPQLWHRGYPLQLLSERNYGRRKAARIRVDIQADFWNGDPDIDAVCRLEHSPECDFHSEYFPIASNAMSPFNSQNTFILGTMAKDYFLFPAVGRMDDIWASYFVQALGNRVAYFKPSVFQRRNDHDLIADMRNEYLGYECNLKLVEALAADPESIVAFLPAKAQWAWKLYRRHFPN